LHGVLRRHLRLRLHAAALLGVVRGRIDLDDSALGPRNLATEEDEALFLIDLHNGDVEDAHSLVAHAAGHALALVHLAGRRAAARALEMPVQSSDLASLMMSRPILSPTFSLLRSASPMRCSLM